MTYGLRTANEFDSAVNKATKVDARGLAARKALAAPGVASINAGSLATRRAGAALVAHGRDASTGQTSTAPTKGGNNFEVKTVGEDDSSDGEGVSDTARSPGSAAWAFRDRVAGGNGGGEIHQGKHVAGGAQAPIGFGGSRSNDQATGPYEGPWDAVATPNGATKARSEGLSGALARRKAHVALRGNADKIWGQGKDDEETGLVVTQEDDDQIPGHEAPKRQQASSQQAAQGTDKVTYRPAYWGDGTGSGSWDNSSQGWSSEGKEDDPRGLKTRQKHLPIVDRAPKAHQKPGKGTYKGGGIRSHQGLSALFDPMALCDSPVGTKFKGNTGQRRSAANFSLPPSPLMRPTRVVGHTAPKDQWPLPIFYWNQTRTTWKGMRPTRHCTPLTERP